MNLPSIKTLRTIAGDRAGELRELLEQKRQTRDYESVREWERQCYHPPSYIERLLCAANEIMRGYGVENLCQPDSPIEEPLWSYINMGDTYTKTLLYCHHTGRFRVGCWGDLPSGLEEYA